MRYLTVTNVLNYRLYIAPPEGLFSYLVHSTKYVSSFLPGITDILGRSITPILSYEACRLYDLSTMRKSFHFVLESKQMKDNFCNSWERTKGTATSIGAPGADGRFTLLSHSKLPHE